MSCRPPRIGPVPTRVADSTVRTARAIACAGRVRRQGVPGPFDWMSAAATIPGRSYPVTAGMLLDSEDAFLRRCFRWDGNLFCWSGLFPRPE